jgi:hypothetical protein
MSIFTRYTWLGDNTIEVVVDVKDGNASIDVNVLPTAGTELAATAAPPLAPIPPDEAVVAASLVEPSPAPVLGEAEAEMTLAAAPYSKKRLGLMGFIRATWFVVFTASGEALTYALNQLTTLNLPPGTATAIGAVGYGVKRAIWPTTQL